MNKTENKDILLEEIDLSRIDSDALRTIIESLAYKIQSAIERLENEGEVDIEKCFDDLENTKNNDAFKEDVRSLIFAVSSNDIVEILLELIDSNYISFNNEDRIYALYEELENTLVESINSYGEYRKNCRENKLQILNATDVNFKKYLKSNLRTAFKDVYGYPYI